MSQKRLIDKAVNLDEKEWPFSSSVIWKEVVKEKPSSFNSFRYADALRLCGKFKEAKRVLDRIELDDVPKTKKHLVFLNYGQLYEDQGKIKQAIKSYQQSIKYDPEENYAYVFLACLLSQKGKLKKSERTLKEALNKEGAIEEVYFNLSTNYARQGKFKAAIKAMKNCLEIDPEYQNGQIFLKDFENYDLLSKEK
jgi:tetratricopeptide (TPR) repeat protein